MAWQAGMPALQRTSGGLAGARPIQAPFSVIRVIRVIRGCRMFSGYLGQAAKLSPQEQCATAFGLVTLNPPFCRSSLKSSTEPLTKSALLGSTTIRTLEE